MSGTDASGQQMTYAQPTEQPNQRAENGACRCDNNNNNNNNNINQLVTSSMILEGGFLKTRARLERPASCTTGFLFWCSASMLSFCTTVCQLQTAQTDDRTQFCIYFSIF